MPEWATPGPGRAGNPQEAELLPRLLDVADERVGWSRPEVDAAEAVSVFKLMLDDELNSASARAAISARPGVVKSIVDAATQALPPDEEAVLHRLGCSVGQPIDRREVWAAREANDALVGLGREGRDAAATAVVNVIQADNDGREKSFEPPRVDDDVADDDEGDDGDFNRRRRNLERPPQPQAPPAPRPARDRGPRDGDARRRGGRPGRGRPRGRPHHGAPPPRLDAQRARRDARRVVKWNRA